MKTKLEELIDLSPPLPVEIDIATFTRRAAFSAQALRELQTLADQSDIVTYGNGLITRPGRIACRP